MGRTRAAPTRGRTYKQPQGVSANGPSGQEGVAPATGPGGHANLSAWRLQQGCGTTQGVARH
eukprot:8526664-Alexandrium_andersonii.AAC.1